MVSNVQWIFGQCLAMFWKQYNIL